MGSGIKRGASLYSFQEEYFLGKLDLEGCIATAASLGAYGIESLAEQMMPGFPDLSDSFYDRWRGWMATYGTVPTAHDMFLDTKLHKDRLLTDEEMVASVRRDVDHAAKLGCSVIRMIVITPPEIMERCAPYARDKGVKLAVEIHAPMDFDHPWIQRHLEVAQRVGSDVLGVVVDMGIYVRRFPRVVSERAIRNGASKAVVRRIVETYDEHGGLEALTQKIEKSGGNAAELALARAASRYISGEPKQMLDYMPFIHHCHAKFYEMTEEGHEYSIPYDEIVAVLKQGGYEGYLSSEYEGNRWIQDAEEVDSIEQVGRQQRMFASLIGS